MARESTNQDANRGAGRAGRGRRAVRPRWLLREGEVEIAKRIEEGENEILSAILSSPVAVREIIEIGERLRNHKIRVKDIVRDAEDEEHEFDEEEADRRIIRLIDKVKRSDKKNQELA